MKMRKEDMPVALDLGKVSLVDSCLAAQLHLAEAQFLAPSANALAQRFGRPHPNG